MTKFLQYKWGGEEANFYYIKLHAGKTRITTNPYLRLCQPQSTKPGQRRDVLQIEINHPTQKTNGCVL